MSKARPARPRPRPRSRERDPGTTGNMVHAETDRVRMGSNEQQPSSRGRPARGSAFYDTHTFQISYRFLLSSFVR